MSQPRRHDNRRSRLPPAAPIEPDVAQRLSILQANRWLHGLPVTVLGELAAVCRLRKLDSGELIAARGQVAEGLAVVISGAVRSASVSEDGREMVYSLLEPGSLWGLVAVLDGDGAVHDTRASGPTELLVIPRVALLRVLDRHPALYRHFTRVLCDRLRHAYGVIDDLGLASLRQRLARKLCTLAMPDFDEPSPAGFAGAGMSSLPATGSRIAPSAIGRIRLTQEELAGMVGATRPAVNRELNAMQRAGLLQMHYGSITLLAFEQLHRLCANRGSFNH